MATPNLKLGENQNVEIDENDNGDLVMRHAPSGAEFKYDSGAGAWKPTAKIDMGGNDITGAGSVGTGEIATTGYTWEDVLSSRSVDTWETAPSDRDIWISVDVTTGSNGVEAGLRMHVNTSQSDQHIGTRDMTIDNGDEIGFSGVRVPKGHEYKVEMIGETGKQSLSHWFELR